MPTYFQRPENALKRANELIAVGKKDRALESLYDVIKSKKHRTWQKIHMQIMEMYVQLCVELKKSHIAKEGLYQYKNICQQVNIKSLEDVIRKYLSLAEEKTEAARKESHQSVVDVDDLDVLQTPEKLLLSAVSGEDTQDRADRTILTPWVKFLWESYRQCLDLLRNNNNVEKLYHEVAQQAFQFCKKYERKTEFRKLCDNLRTHLSHVYKNQNNQRAINLNNPDSQAMHQETRLIQLDSAIQMELWQEAFKAVEDLHGLIMLTKKPSLLANYYQKLALVFWNSDNHLFHACSYLRLFHLTREQRKNLSSDDLQKLANRVLCATLAIPLAQPRNQIDVLLDSDDTSTDKQRRLAALIGLPNPPTRPQLVKDLVKYNVVQLAHPELQNFYKWLEVEFSPLKLSSRVASSLDFVANRDDLSQYVPALQHITITRLLKQVSQVYTTIEFDRLLGLIPFATKFSLEKVIVDAAKNLELQVRIDHKTKSLQFGGDLYVGQKDDLKEGPYIQSLTSEQIRHQLSQMASALKKASDILRPKSELEKNEELRLHIVQTYRQVAKKEHFRILQRRQIIEERKEELEILNQQREREEQEQLEMELEEQNRLEYERREREIEERLKMKKEEEHSEIKKKVARERLQQLRNTEVGAKAFANLNEEEIAEMDVDDILAKQVEQLEKERREMQERLKVQEKKVDYFERAKRLEELPLLEKAYEEERVKAKIFWEQQEKEKIERQKEERKIALENRDRLMKMKKDQETFLEQLKDKRKHKFQEELARFELFLKEERLKRMMERKRKRKEDRHQRWIQEKEEAEQRERDEALRKQFEEKERIAREKKEKEDQEYLEKKKKLDEIAERQRQREREIEEKAKKTTGGASEEKEKEKWRPRAGGWRAQEGGKTEGRSADVKEEGEDKSWRGRGEKDRSDVRDLESKSGGWRERAEDREIDSDRLEEDIDGKLARDERRTYDKKGPSRDEVDRRPAVRDDLDKKGPRDDDSRVPSKDDFDKRGPREDFDRRGPREDFDRRGPREDFDRRGPKEDFDRRGPKEDFDRRGPKEDFDRRGPREEFDRRGPREDDRRGPRDDDRRGPRDDDRRGPRDDRRGLFRDEFGKRGAKDEFDRREDFDRRGARDEDLDRRGGGQNDFERRGPPRNFDRGGEREEGGSWRGGGGRRQEDDKPRDERRIRDDKLPSRDDRDRQYGRDDRDRPSGRDLKDDRDRDRPPRDFDRQRDEPRERGGDSWRKADGRSVGSSSATVSRDDRRGGTRVEEGWRKTGDDKRDDNKSVRDSRPAPSRSLEKDDRKAPKDRKQADEDDEDGWTTVKR